MKRSSLSHSLVNSLWDLFCTLSLVGIWPRFIEPRLIFTTKLDFKIPFLPPALKGLKILQISDLHLHPKVPDYFLNKLLRKINLLSPDIIVLTGDFLCYASLADPKRLHKFLQELKAPFGCFAVLGNHDYAECVSVNASGEYDVISLKSSLGKAFGRMKESITLKKKTTERARNVLLNSELLELFKKTSIRLLHNETEILSIKDTKLNLCGLGEYMLERLDATKAFENYDVAYPGIILLHNPDGATLLKDYPGNLILCGHTHGGQVNLPWFWKKFTLIENPSLKKGLAEIFNQKLYINRGIGSILPFRFFSPPEILLLTLETA